MKKLLLTLFVLPCLVVAQQAPFGHNAKWIFYYDEFGITGIDSIYHHTNVTLFGKEWQELKRGKYNHLIHVRTENDSIFYLDENNIEALLYVRNAPVGFTWQFANYTSTYTCADTPQVTVIGVGYDTVSGQSLRYQSLVNIRDSSNANYRISGSHVLNEKIYDRLGNWPGLGTYITPLLNLCGFAKTQLTYPAYSLRCYTDDSVSLFFHPSGKCYIDLSATTSERVQFSVHPNPTNGVVRIESNMDVQEVTVYTLQGQKIAVFSKTTTLELPETSGMYLLQLTFSNGQTLFERVVRR